MSKSDKLLAQALAELMPLWAHFGNLEIFQWAWEFLRRNLLYIQAIEEIENIDSNVMQAYAELAEKKKQNKILKDYQSPLFDPPSVVVSHRPEEIALQFGMSILLSPKCEMLSDIYWNYILMPKAHSDYRLAQAYDPETRTIRNLTINEEEHFALMNYNAPYQAYNQEIEKRYEQKQKLTPLPQFQTSKFPELIKMYDLRKWGEADGRAIIRNGEKTSCISWAMIGKYLSPKTPYTAQMLRKRFEAVEDYINGNYMELLKYKGAFKNNP
jgi:hypothetical protein